MTLTSPASNSSAPAQTLPEAATPGRTTNQRGTAGLRHIQSTSPDDNSLSGSTSEICLILRAREEKGKLIVDYAGDSPARSPADILPIDGT